jgi:hypothetical protein
MRARLSAKHSRACMAADAEQWTHDWLQIKEEWTMNWNFC